MFDFQIPREGHLAELRDKLTRSPVVALLGARQVGKTTLARALASESERVTFLDLEDPREVARLDEPMVALEPLRGLVVIDEVQRRPDLFPVLRVLADRRPLPARFLVLGSASPALLRQGSESLAGRLAFHDLEGFDLSEVGVGDWEKLWLRGGLPPSFLAAEDWQAEEWRRDLLRTFVERDLPGVGISLPGRLLFDFWTMLAHYHGQTWNSAELARSFAISQPTVRRYRDQMAGLFLLRLLQPWRENLGRRIARTPRAYVADSGLLHALLGILTSADLRGHPKVGASWEGFALAQVVRAVRARAEECYFWSVHGGPELDLLIVRGSERRGFEFKRTDAPRVARSMRTALDVLRLTRLEVVHVGRYSYPMAEKIHAVAARDIVGLRRLGGR